MNAIAFGLTLPQRAILFGALTPRLLVELAVRADQNRLFDSVWVGDSLLAKPRPDSLTLLGGLATATTRVTLGVACMASFAVRDPILMAYQWATLDMLSGGSRFHRADFGFTLISVLFPGDQNALEPVQEHS
jgi:alkanesulfonate monooxygenase SsuD/methylene tetrahydromethanopterin reductase-like flavin-dependent oxidoreductase (luciferase family)